MILNKDTKKLVIGVVLAVVFVGGYLYVRNLGETRQAKEQEEQAMMAEKFKQASEAAMEKDDKMMKDDKMSVGYHGKTISGSKSLYLEFVKTDYDKAVSENKVIFLNFYANWCPICRAEAPDLKAGFNDLKTENVVGFQVNWNDSDTDDAEKELAKKYNISYQHTKVIVKDGKAVYNQIEQWDKDQVVSNLGKY